MSLERLSLSCDALYHSLTCKRALYGHDSLPVLSHAELLVLLLNDAAMTALSSLLSPQPTASTSSPPPSEREQRRRDREQQHAARAGPLTWLKDAERLCLAHPQLSEGHALTLRHLAYGLSTAAQALHRHPHAAAAAQQLDTPHRASIAFCVCTEEAAQPMRRAAGPHHAVRSAGPMGGGGPAGEAGGVLCAAARAGADSGTGGGRRQAEEGRAAGAAGAAGGCGGRRGCAAGGLSHDGRGGRAAARGGLCAVVGERAAEVGEKLEAEGEGDAGQDDSRQQSRRAEVEEVRSRVEAEARERRKEREAVVVQRRRGWTRGAVASPSGGGQSGQPHVRARVVTARRTERQPREETKEALSCRSDR